MFGYCIAVVEIGLFAITSYGIRKRFKPLQEIQWFSYYWFMMTILTFVWECAYIFDFDQISLMGRALIDTKKHVWTREYDLSYVFPWKLARIFYAEYGAYADREYLGLTDEWSKTVESSHAIFCGLFSLFTLLLKMSDNVSSFNICLGISMGSQFMNSLLYMINYYYQSYDKDNINYITDAFPAGEFFLKRGFMYVNVFWLICPAFTMIYYLLFNSSYYKNHNKKQNHYRNIKYPPPYDKN